MWMERWIRLRGEPVIFALPCCHSLEAIPVHEVLELFFMVFCPSPGGVAQLLGDEIEPVSRLCVCHDPRLSEKFLVGSARRRERPPRLVLRKLQVNHLSKPGFPKIGFAVLATSAVFGQ